METLPPRAFQKKFSSYILEILNFAKRNNNLFLSMIAIIAIVLKQSYIHYSRIKLF